MQLPLPLGSGHLSTAATHVSLSPHALQQASFVGAPST
jgi:hypothetical protein